MAGVNDNGQVRFFLDDRHGGQVQRVAGRALKRADAALTEDNVLIAAGHDVLGGHDPLLNGIRQAALEQNGLVHLADGLEQLEVLHIARADLHNVHILLELGDVDLVHQLTDDRQAGDLAGLDHIQDALGAQTLEGVGARAGLVRAAAQEVGTARLDSLGHLDGVLLALNAARTCHNGDGRIAADPDAVDVHDGILRVEQAVGALVRGGHTGHVLDPGVCQHVLLGNFRRITDKAKDVVVGTADQRDRQALLLEVIDNAVQLDLGRTFFSGNNHGSLFLIYFLCSIEYCVAGTDAKHRPAA